MADERRTPGSRRDRVSNVAGESPSTFVGRSSKSLRSGVGGGSADVRSGSSSRPDSGSVSPSDHQMSNAKKLIERGVEVLDKHRPGWEYGIDLDTLSNPTQVLDMVFGDYFTGASHLRYPPMDYGFDDGIAPKEALMKVWKEAVETRRGSQMSLFK